MTFAHHGPALQAPNLNAALCALRNRGLRVSMARRSMLEVLYETDRPVSAEELAARVPGSDVASVHRNLDVLEGLGLVRHVHLGHGPGMYSLPSTSEVEFLSCERCGVYEAVEPRRLDGVRDAIEREHGFFARFTHFPIVGICRDCQSAPLETTHHAHP